MSNLVQLLSNADCGGIGPIISFIRYGIMPIIQIGIPIILIIMGSIDLGKAVMSSDDKEIKGATSKLIKRVIAAAVVFFIPFLVNLVMNLIGKAGSQVSGGTDYVGCWNDPNGDPQFDAKK